MLRGAFVGLLLLVACDVSQPTTTSTVQRGWTPLPYDGPSGFMVHENGLGFAVYCTDSGHVFHMVSSENQRFSIDDGFYMGNVAGTLSDWACNDEATLCATIPPALPSVRDEIIMFSQLGQPQTYSFYVEGSNVPRGITLDWSQFPGGMRAFVLRCQASANSNPDARRALERAARDVEK